MKRIIYGLNLFLLAVMIALDVLFIFSPSLLLKSLASACFVLIGLGNVVFALKMKGKKQYPFLLVIGCILAMAGDIVIYDAKDISFMLGALLFALAHIVYLIAYYSYNKFSWLDLVLSGIIFIPSCLFMTLCPLFQFGNVIMEFVCVIYAFILSLMVGKAISNLRKGTAIAFIVVLGSVFYYVSDFMLLLNTFGGIHGISRILCLSFYYPAQFLLAFSIILYADKDMNLFQRIYCRCFQLGLKLALPFLPYRDPKILSKIEDIAVALSKQGKKFPLIVTDQTIRKLGLLKPLEESLTAAGIPYAIYDQVVANPTSDHVEEVKRIYEGQGCDCFIAFGGGSPMDCAKAAGALLARPKKKLKSLKGILKVRKRTPLLIAVPTTAGTGSETTLAAVIVDSKTRHKYAINDFPLIPSYAVLDERVTLTLPKAVISTTGMDALTHAIEAYIGRGGNASTRKDALEAIKLVFENIEASYEGNREAAKQMLIASHKAGRAFTKAYVGYVHALAHALGGKYNIAHGLANAILLPVVLKEYGKAIDKKLWKIAIYCGFINKNVSYEQGSKLILDRIVSLNHKLNIGNSFPEICLGDLEELASFADKEANPLYPVPVLWNKEKFKNILEGLKGEKMEELEISDIIQRQRKYFESGATLNVKRRLHRLENLYASIKRNLSKLHEGLKKDLGKSETESYMCETGLTMSELSYMIKHLKKLAKPKKVATPLAHMLSKSYRLPSPYGTVLIMNPWNYPVLLSLEPLIDAIAAGNTVVLKLSAYSPNTNLAIKEVIESVFPPEYVSVLFGGAQINTALMQCQFDYIFFTGSKKVGKLVYEHATEHLTPVTLELGGKSPCIVDESANIKLAAKRIVWGKFLNLGQTCVAPDYIFCSEKIHDELVQELIKQIQIQFGKDPLSNVSYGKIINEKHYTRLLGLIDNNKICYGGKTDEAALKIEPTILDQVSYEDAVMQEEIFGPILPILTYREEEEMVKYIKEHDAPLALYIFSSNHKRIERITRGIGFGGGCINDVVIHLATPYMPFGGFGASGIGSYHGKVGFETFSHYKSILKKSTAIDLPMRYQPYKKINKYLIKKFLH